MPFFNLFKKKSSTVTTPQAFREYLAFFDTKQASKIPFRDATFVILDTETSGLNPRKDKMLSIAALGMKNFQLDINNCFERYIQQSDYQPGQDVQVHGILAAQLHEGTVEKAVLKDFLFFIKNSILVGHHIGFDLAILNQAIKHHFGGKLKNRTLDTARLAQRLNNPLMSLNQVNRSASLDDLCQEFSIPLGTRHTAAGDAFITSLLLMKLLARLERKKVILLSDLLKT